MALRLKTKVFLGLTFLFVLVVVMGGIGAYSIHTIAAESKEVLKDNYESVQHARQMMQLLDEMRYNPVAKEKFAVILEKQEMNITEAGEKQLTENIREAFDYYDLQLNSGLTDVIRKNLYAVMDLNMHAITLKNEQVQERSLKLLSYLVLTGMVCLLLSLSFIFNFPSYITDPITKLAAGIRQTANKNHEQSLHFTPGDEFGELSDAFKSMAELDLAKTHFIATVSHELKTPISAIKISAELLEDKRVGETNEEQKSLVRNIKEDADRLLKITAELLDRTQAETGKIRLQMQTTQPQEIVDYAIAAVNAQAEQKKIKFEVLYGENISGIEADREKTAWVLVNLLSNAIRYSPEQGKIIVEVKKKEDKTEFSVKDSGKGIEPKYRNKIFDRYFQVPESTKTGTGLGLAISREFIEAQGGTIRLESESGSGCTFIFSLKGENPN